MQTSHPVSLTSMQEPADAHATRRHPHAGLTLLMRSHIEDECCAALIVTSMVSMSFVARC